MKKEIKGKIRQSKDNLHVRPSHRSKKIGSALLNALARALIDKGHKTGYLWVFECNKKAIDFTSNSEAYRRNGR